VSFGQYLIAELKKSWVFLIVFIVVGIVLALLVYQHPIDWAGRLGVAIFATVVFVVFSAWQKKRRAE